VSRLDRLARDTRFLLTLLDSGLDVEFCDLPTMAGPMGKMVVTVMAAVAEMEAGLISERTKAGLRIARERGVVLGGRNAQSDRNAQEAAKAATTRRDTARRSWSRLA
jgi:DNA invertase Pin-like site-specific DNA recombinase